MGRHWGYQKSEAQRNGFRELGLIPSGKTVLPGCCFLARALRKSPIELSFHPVRKKCCQAHSEECNETKCVERGWQPESDWDERLLMDSTERNSNKQKEASPHSLPLPSGFPQVPLLGETKREQTVKEEAELADFKLQYPRV